MGASVYTIIEYRKYDSYWSIGHIDLSRDIELLRTAAAAEERCVQQRMR